MKFHSLFRYGRRVFCPVLFGYAFLGTQGALAHAPLGSSRLSFFVVQQQVSGRVTDASGPLPGVAVAVKGTARTALTDLDGRYSIAASDGEVLIFSYIGYAPVEVPVSGAFLDELLKPEARSIQEVVVNAGYYSVKESERTGSIARITSKDIENQPVTNVLAAMQGRMAGVSITQNTGMPGGGFDIKIRGQNSLRQDGNRPLYVIDGVPYDSESLTDGFASAVLAGRPSPLNSIPPGQIASIEVLKDADATAIYGSRGANGVVLVTTKKGKGGKTTVSANFTRGASRVTRFSKLMDTGQYLSMRREAFANDGITEYPEYAYDVNGTWDQNRYTDWQKELLGGMALFSTANVSVSGGSERTAFLLSGGTSEQSTVFAGNFKYRTGNVRASLNHQGEDGKFKLSFAAGLSLQDNRLPGNDYTAEAMSLVPNAPALYDGQGNLNWENNTFNNPLRNNLAQYLSQTDDLLSSLKLSYEIAEGLEAVTSFGYTSTKLRDRNLVPSTTSMPSVQLTSASSYMSMTIADRTSWIAEPQLQWRRSFGMLDIDLLAGSTFQMQEGESLLQLGRGFSSNSLIGNLAAASSIRVLGNEKKEYRYQAFFGRANFNLNKKYLLNLTARRDGSSRFGPGRQFATFGAVGGAWLFHKERLFGENSTVSFGKLRASYGSTGSDQIGDYQYFNTYGTTGIQYAGAIGLEPTRLFNPNFAWETNRKLELGTEVGLFGDRVFVTAAWYRNTSGNQLTGIPLPATTGFQSVQANLNAVVRNTGLEVTLRTENIASGNFKWTSSLNISFSRNRLVSFPGLEGSTYASYYAVGQPISIQKLYQYEGIDPVTGIYKFADLNGDGSVDYLDMSKTADLSPKFFGGLHNEFRYKSLRLEFLVQFVKQRNRDQALTMGFGGGMNNQSVAMLDHTQTGGTAGATQIYTAGFNEQAVMASYMYSSSDAVITDASFARLKNIALTWDVPTAKSTGVACQLTLQAQNLLTITAYKGGDPEFPAGGYLPPLRTITAGIGFSF
ncbi:SusC/RagA family TonB-linked outer membrane protein [Flavobacterium macacae]|uniref:SusC/RagA family TonB-linked outer membrane protein n=1 Tax=Flavobacterium macacae TaxID=2488993 RepID=A0A3P3W0C4_9FLAO|nr:SusC/RagA family TonB-linked outer membrane protein [Flavobacterium macacae]RRJ88430.1 SusC/RagA family TonB-linked outer membrane protein [Flavobacterium macacae]